MTEEEKIFRAGELVLRLMTTLPGQDDSMDWDRIHELATQLLELAETPSNE